MAAKFIENFIFLRGVGESIDVQNLKVSFIYLNIDIILFVIPLSLKIHKTTKH